MKKLLCMLAFVSSTITFSMLPPHEASCTDGRTPLITAILRGTFINQDFIEKHIATINVQDNSGRTALHHAAANSQKDIIRLLIAHGAQRSLKDCEGKTAEDIAIERKRIRAHNDDRSYEHCAEQTPSSPLYDTSSATDLTTIYTPRSPIRLGNSQSEEDASPSSSPSQKYYDPRYPDYASLI